MNTGSLNNPSDLTTCSLSFDASNGGNPVDKLIVSAGTETTGVALTLIPNTVSGRNRGIWYLDNPFSGGAANIIVTGAATLNHMRLGVASISGSAPGAAIGNIASAANVSLNVPVTNSFVFAAHASNWIDESATTSSKTHPPAASRIGTPARRSFIC